MTKEDFIKDFAGPKPKRILENQEAYHFWVCDCNQAARLWDQLTEKGFTVSK